MTTALVVVDVQNDFCEGGSLAVTGGAAVAAGVAELIASGRYDVVVATRDHHIDPGSHFSDDPDFVDSWPPHCVVGTPGEDLHPPLDPSMFAATFFKGEYAAAYSGFEGVTAPGGKQPGGDAGPGGKQPGGGAGSGGEQPGGGAGSGGKQTERGLAPWLRDHGIDAIDVCGIATDYCVRATALDGAREGFVVRVLEQLTAAVSPDKLATVRAEWAAAGVGVA